VTPNEIEVERYSVSFSGRVRQKLIDLGQIARGRGDGKAFLAALLEFHRRLEIYPQFGDPLVDLRDEEGHVRIGIIAPLAMRYVVFEARRKVLVAAFPVLIQKPKADAGT